MLARVHERVSIGWEPVTLKKIEIYSFHAGPCISMGYCSECAVECHYEVSRSHLHGDPLQIESEEIAIFNTLSSRFLTRKRYDALTWAR